MLTWVTVRPRVGLRSSRLQQTEHPARNSVHLDLHAADLPGAIERAVGLGAKQVADFAEYGAVWTTLTDPEGTLFDIGAD
jgi:uncharacterized glyoxalase superfamily protein PhnB